MPREVHSFDSIRCVYALLLVLEMGRRAMVPSPSLAGVCLFVLKIVLRLHHVNISIFYCNSIQWK